MTPAERVRRLRYEAAELADQQRFVEARDAYLVAADAAEEIGLPGFAADAWALRAAARRMHVVAWARSIDPKITSSDVMMRPRRGTGTREEVRLFTIASPGPQGRGIFLTVVRVGKRGDVRIVAFP